MFLKETSLPAAGRTANDRQRTIDDVRQHPIGDLRIIVGQIALRDFLVGIENLIGMGEAHSLVFVAGSGGDAVARRAGVTAKIFLRFFVVSPPCDRSSSPLPRSAKWARRGGPRWPACPRGALGMMDVEEAARRSSSKLDLGNERRFNPRDVACLAGRARKICEW